MGKSLHRHRCERHGVSFQDGPQEFWPPGSHILVQSPIRWIRPALCDQQKASRARSEKILQWVLHSRGRQLPSYRKTQAALGEPTERANNLPSLICQLCKKAILEIAPTVLERSLDDCSLCQCLISTLWKILNQNHVSDPLLKYVSTEIMKANHWLSLF